jgi:hypothetical protein
MANNSAQDRYATPLTVKKLEDGRMVYRSCRPRGVKNNSLRDVVVPATDVMRMDKVSYNAYGSSQRWWKIAAANRRVDGSMYFKPGSDVIIPSE